MPPYGQRRFLRATLVRGAVGAVGAAHSEGPSCKKQAPSASNHTQNPFVIHQGRVQNEVMCLPSERHDGGASLRQA